MEEVNKLNLEFEQFKKEASKEEDLLELVDNLNTFYDNPDIEDFEDLEFQEDEIEEVKIRTIEDVIRDNKQKQLFEDEVGDTQTKKENMEYPFILLNQINTEILLNKIKNVLYESKDSEGQSYRIYFSSLNGSIFPLGEGKINNELIDIIIDLKIEPRLYLSKGNFEILESEYFVDPVLFNPLICPLDNIEIEEVDESLNEKIQLLNSTFLENNKEEPNENINIKIEQEKQELEIIKDLQNLVKPKQQEEYEEVDIVDRSFYDKIVDDSNIYKGYKGIEFNKKDSTEKDKDIEKELSKILLDAGLNKTEIKQELKMETKPQETNSVEDNSEKVNISQNQTEEVKIEQPKKVEKEVEKKKYNTVAELKILKRESLYKNQFIDINEELIKDMDNKKLEEETLFSL